MKRRHNYPRRPHCSNNFRYYENFAPLGFFYHRDRRSLAQINRDASLSYGLRPTTRLEAEAIRAEKPMKTYRPLIDLKWLPF